MNSLLSHDRSSLRDAFRAEGIDGFRADQVLRWIYRRRVRDFCDMSDLSRSLREQLGEAWSTRTLERRAVHDSADGTRKLVLATEDGGEIEAVLIPEEGRRTLCVSSQVGCSLDCTFCATALLGFGRNLRADEIVDQMLHGAELLAERGEALTHVVFMGMGEPLLNLRNVTRAIGVATDPAALGLSHRRITVSTSGVVPQIAELGRTTRARLAVSLHATTDEVRDRLVPLNKRYPIAALLEACRAYPLARRDRLSFEYTLIRDTNDSDDDARRLVRLLHGLRAKVNLIPMNEHAGTSFRRPTDARVERFASLLSRARAPVSIRRSRGDDISAACGQLGALPSAESTVSHPSGRYDSR